MDGISAASAQAASSPGRIGPGLIEATPDSATRSPASRHLPGESARASLKHGHETVLHQRVRDLPGESARASLKRMTGRLRLRPPALSPGRIGPGLIEALVDLVSQPGGTRSPGRIGPGLIEACRRHPLPIVQCRNLPGESARASLKLGEALGCERVTPHLPGESARASLKQAGERVLAYLVGYDLPGESARASLKLHGADPSIAVRPAGTDLPGESARASLKLERRGDPSRNARQIESPGRIGPGLIEAYLIRYGTIAVAIMGNLPGESARASLKPRRGRNSQVSEIANCVSPGRIGPGLIEAMADCRATARRWRISRANRPGPH